MNNEQQSAWEHHSRLIIGSLLWNTRDLYEGLAFEHFVEGRHFYPGNPNYAKAYAFIAMAFREGNLTLSPDVIWSQSNRELPLEWLNNLRDNCNTSTDGAISSGKIIKNYYLRAERIKSLDGAKKDYANQEILPEDTDAGLIANLVMAEVDSYQPADVHSIAKFYEGELDSGIVKMVTPTGDTWFDSKTVFKDGLWEGQMIAINGAQKNRKTSLVRNWILGAARTFVEFRMFEGHRFPIYVPNENVCIAFLAYENNRVDTMMDLRAMLAYEFLLYTKSVDLRYGESTLGEYCNRTDMHKLAKKIHDGVEINASLRTAIKYAISQLSGLNIHIYDSHPKNGNLRSLNAFRKVMNRHVYVTAKPGQHKIAVVDYVQLVRNGGANVYNDMVDLVSETTHYAQTHDCTMILLSQANESHKDAKARGEPKGSLGAKGGGDLGAAVHYFFETEYDQNGKQQVSLLASRMAAAGVAQGFRVHPESGYITGTVHS